MYQAHVGMILLMSFEWVDSLEMLLMLFFF